MKVPMSRRWTARRLTRMSNTAARARRASRYDAPMVVIRTSGRGWMTVIAATLMSAAFVKSPAQESRPPADPDLRRAVESYLAERDAKAADGLLDALVQRRDASAGAVAAALSTSDTAVTRERTLLVPAAGDVLACTIRAPEGHASDRPRLPVVLDISGGSASSWMKLDEVIVVFVPGFTPPEFSDEGRDAFLKVLHATAHQTHGDPDRLWVCGFSWAGHASFDIALHRPGALRGIVPLGGGPRRTWFRLLPQLASVKVAAFCGQTDDAELVWNLREVARLAPKHKLDYTITLDPAKGHSLPLLGMESVPATILATGAHASPASSGTLLADGPLVESPLLRVDAVDPARVLVPARVPVSASLSGDAQRRATIDAMTAKVAKVTWRIDERKDETLLTLSGDGVTAATVFLREPSFHVGRKVTVRAGSRMAFSGIVAPEPRMMLTEARRTGGRLRIVLGKVAVKLD